MAANKIVIDATADSAVTHRCGAVVTLSFATVGQTRCWRCGLVMS